MITSNITRECRERIRVQTEIKGESLAKQDQKKECEIGHILNKYRKKGVLPRTNPLPAKYMDASNTIEYGEALNFVVEAQTRFQELDSDTRKRFGNDPKQFLDFVTNSDNLEEMVEMGLAEAVLDEPQKVEIVNPPQTGTPSGENEE